MGEEFKTEASLSYMSLSNKQTKHPKELGHKLLGEIWTSDYASFKGEDCGARGN